MHYLPVLDMMNRYEDMATVEYVASEADPPAARKLIEDSNLTTRFKERWIKKSDGSGRATNAIVFGPSVKQSDVEFLREMLTDAGIQFDTVKREKEWTGKDSTKIWIGHY